MIDIFATGVRRLQGVGYWVPRDTWRRGGWSAVPTLDGKGWGNVLGCKSPVQSFGAVAIQQRVLVDKIYLPVGQSYLRVLFQ